MRLGLVGALESNLATFETLRDTHAQKLGGTQVERVTSLVIKCHSCDPKLVCVLSMKII